MHFFKCRRLFKISLLVITIVSIQASNSNETESDSPPSLTGLYNMDIDSREISNITTNPNLDKLDEKFAKCQGIDIREVTIAQLQNYFTSGQLSAVQLTQCYLTRLDRMNPVLRVLVQLNSDALKEATKLDEERKSGMVRGPLHGIPILLKDGIGTGDGMENTAGSLALLGIRPKSDAEVVSHLRKAGAIILGKANLSEFFWFRGNNIPNGWSGRGGQCRNAYNLNKTPEGSSSGSAVAVSANLCVASLGTETDGSLLAPSSIAGVFAMKPTLGLASTKGVIPLSKHQDNVGPVARSVHDLSILMDAMIPAENRPSGQPQSYTDFVLKNETASYRVGVLRYPFWNNTALNSTDLGEKLPHMEQMLDLFNISMNIDLVDPVQIVNTQLFVDVSPAKEAIMMMHDFKHEFNDYLKNEVIYDYPENARSLMSNSNSADNYGEAYLASSQNSVTSLQELIEFYEEHPIPEGYNHDTLISSQATDGILNETYVKARDSNRLAAKQFLDELLETDNLDAVVVPTYARMQEPADVQLKDFPVLAFSLASISGYPSLTIPAGIGLDGVPFGIALIGKPNTEHILLRIAHEIEHMDPKRKPPQFLV